MSDDVAVEKELRRRGLQTEIDSQARSASLIKSDEMFSLKEDASSFRAAIVARESNPPPPCYPEIYESQ
jgi:hypothetical protein